MDNTFDVLNDYDITLINIAILSNIVKLSLHMTKDQVLKKASDKLWIIDLYADLNGPRPLQPMLIETLRQGVIIKKGYCCRKIYYR